LIKVNLLPLEFQRKAAERVNVWWLAILPVVVLCFLVPNYLSTVNKLTSVKKKLDAVNQEVEKCKGVKERLKSIEEEIRGLESNITFIREKKSKQKFWAEVLDKLSAVLPSDIWLESLSISPEGTITMSGNTFRYSSVATFYRALNSSSYFGGATLASCSKTYGEGGKPDSVTFSISCGYQGGGK